ncbi:sensor histidine kinase [Hyunsoonleella pacifica]|nr:histidine kinase [Hyunsoonleella pacifica]
MKFIHIDPKETILNAIIFVSNWVLISLVIHKFNYLKVHRKIVIKLLGLLVIFIAIIIVDDTMKMADNPFTLILIVCFFMFFFYNISPQTFKKYKYYIIGFYILILAYFSYIRLNIGEDYFLQKKSILLFFLVSIPIIIVLWAYEQWKWFKNLKAEKAEAELLLLKTQVDPHFFFNTLNNLHALTLKKDDKAPEMVLKLSHIMRYTIYEGKKDIVFLKDEITFLENYIELHKIRYHKTLKVSLSHNINDSDTVAPLLFIILVENAFKHGAEKLTENAFITMHLESNPTSIHFTIQNNFDIDEHSLQQGIGLDNLKRRLNLIYPKKHNLVIEQIDNIYKSDLKIEKKY